MISLCPRSVLAAEEMNQTEGCIQVVLPSEAKDVVIRYAKVGEWNNGELIKYKDEQVLVTGSTLAAHDGSACIEALEEGMYQLTFSGNPEYEFAPVLVSIPLWSEQEHQMIHEIRVIPKYIRHVLPTHTEEDAPQESDMMTSPKTGDASATMVFIAFGAISLIIVVIISCHNRFKCGRITFK